MVEEILGELLVEKNSALVIGDTSHDMLMAANAGVDRLGVSYGAHHTDTLQMHAPIVVLDSFRDVHQWLKNNA
jgi:phosphoglycolate phosphatase